MTLGPLLVMDKKYSKGEILSRYNLPKCLRKRDIKIIMLHSNFIHMEVGC